MKRLYILFLLVNLVVIMNAQLPVDSLGWTIIEPSADSEIIYVSSSEGSDDNDGLSKETPVATVKKAKDLARDGYPDYILFKRGDIWENEGFGYFKSGRSATEPLVVSYYGKSGDRPRFNLLYTFISNYNDDISNIALIGLEFYGYTRDPHSSEFSDSSRLTVINFEADPKGENILIEDCVSRYAQFGSFSNNNGSSYRAMKNIKIRRCIAFGAYAAGSCCEHVLATRAQGFYASGVDGLIVEDCLWDQNGWNPDVATAKRNMFNHNFYIQYHNEGNIRFTNNIIARGSSHGAQMRAGGIAENNLYVQNALGLYLSGNSDRDHRADTIRAVKNVFMEGKRMDLERFHTAMVSPAVVGLEAKNKPDGVDMLVKDNIVANRIDNGTNSGMNIEDGITVTDNIVYKWNSSENMNDPDWLDPDVSLGSYHASLGKEGTTEAFLREARKRPIKTWWPEYSAAAVNDYIREGFSYDTDTIVPHAPRELQAEIVLDTMAKINWPQARDNIRVSHYSIIFNDMLAKDKWSKNNYVFTGLKPDTEYNVKIISFDRSGNQSTDTASFTFSTLPVDTVPPTVPQNLSVTDKSYETIGFEWDASTDDQGCALYNIFLEDSMITRNPIDSANYIIYGLDEFTSYQIAVEAVDTAGNISGKSEYLIATTADTTKPTVPENIQYEMTTDDSVKISWDEASDNDQVVGYAIYLDSVLFKELVVSPCTIKYVDNLQNRAIQVSAIDKSGNESALSGASTIPVGIYQEKAYFTVYPNPTGEYIMLSSFKDFNKAVIYDMQGRLIKSFQDRKRSLSRLNLSGLMPGHYIVRVEFETGKSYQFKFLKK